MTTQQKASNSLKQGWAVICSALLVFTFSATEARADLQKSGLQAMVYEVYASGIHAVQANLDIDFSKKDRFDIFMSANTRGFLGSLVPWSGTFESHGWVVSDSDFRPELHKSTAIWRDEEEIKEYAYTKDRRFKGLTTTEGGKPAKKEEIEDELTQGTTDVLSATLEVLQEVAATGKCQGTSEVFDGKRRFKMKFNDKGTEQLKTTRYNIYAGPATVCTVEVLPVAGKWHEKPRGWMSIQEQGRERGTMPTVWMAQIKEGAPAVPVKVLVKTAYGSLFMHLAEYKSGEQTLVAAAREKN